MIVEIKMDDGSGILSLLILGIIIGFMIGYYVASDNYKTEAINRNYAIYCPSDGNFAWKDECK